MTKKLSKKEADAILRQLHGRNYTLSRLFGSALGYSMLAAIFLATAAIIKWAVTYLFF